MVQKALGKHIHHLDKKLVFRLRLFVIISILMLGIVGYDIFVNVLSVEFAVLGVVVGVIGGILSARMYHLSWDHDAKKIVSRLDVIGVIILVLYIVFVIFRSKLIGFFIQGSQVGAVGFSITAGVMIGRVVGTRGAIIRILEDRGII